MKNFNFLGKSHCISSPWDSCRRWPPASISVATLGVCTIPGIPGSANGASCKQPSRDASRRVASPPSAEAAIWAAEPRAGGPGVAARAGRGGLATLSEPVCGQCPRGGQGAAVAVATQSASLKECELLLSSPGL